MISRGRTEHALPSTNVVPGPRWDISRGMASLLPTDPQLWGSSVLHLQDMFASSLASLITPLLSLSALPGLCLPNIENAQASIDLCAAIAGKKWVAPSDVRACFTSFPVDPDEKTNVGGNYSLPSPSLSVFTSPAITRLSQLPLGSSTSTRPPTTRSGPPSRSLPMSMKISSATSSESTVPDTRTILSSTSTLRVLSRG